jgi:DNA-binding CsgD family transcriptional regulator
MGIAPGGSTMDLCLPPRHDADGSERTLNRSGRVVGLADEHARLERLLAVVAGGDGRAVVVHGPAGSGKTTLLEHAIGSAPEFCALRVAGVESERDLAYAGLHRLCAPMLDRLNRLPLPQRQALGAAFGLHPAGQVDTLFVGLAVLGLFACVSADRPLLCAVDDADRLDEPSRRILAPVARRLGSLQIAMVLTVMEPVEDLAGLPELVLRPLTDSEARMLLSLVAPGPLDIPVRDRIVAESRGNPRDLIAATGLMPEQLAGGFGLPAAPPPTDSTTRRVRALLAAVPWQTRRFMLLAAAEPEGDWGLLRRATAALGIDPVGVHDAPPLDLDNVGSHVTFDDPRMRSVVYHDAPLDERRRVHEALADACDPEVDPDRPTWHRALATLAPDDAVASDLERSATRVGARGGVAASAALLAHAARLTAEGTRRAHRALAAAGAKLDAGSLGAVAEFLTLASEGPLDGVGLARLALLRARLALARSGHGDPSALLLDAVWALGSVDSRLGHGAYLEALELTIASDRPGIASAIAAAAGPASALVPGHRPSVGQLLLDGWVRLFTEGHAGAMGPLRRAVEAALRPDTPCWLGLASRTAAVVADHQAALELASRRVRRAREAGALMELSLALDHLATVHIHAGDFDAAAGLVDEAHRVSAMTGQVRVPSGSLMLAAWRGAEAEFAELVQASRIGTAIPPDGHQLPHSACAAAAVLHNGLGHYQGALAAARRAGEHDDVGSPWVLAELVDAAARTGELDDAVAAYERLAARTRAAGTEWALGIQARARAVISDGDDADKQYRTAVERLGRCRAVPDLARAHLLYGEWLRRRRRRLDARPELRAAHQLFSGLGAAAFARRAADELLATGARARRRTVDEANVLTPRETQVAVLAQDRRSNAQIGAELFISARTVEYHLRKVFDKLGIDSRRQLAEVLAL